jgi:hypothetical protein
MSCEWKKGEHPNEVLRIEFLSKPYTCNARNWGKIFSSKQVMRLEKMPAKLARTLRKGEKWLKRVPAIITAETKEGLFVETIFSRDIWNPLIYASAA